MSRFPQEDGGSIVFPSTPLSPHLHQNGRPEATLEPFVCCCTGAVDRYRPAKISALELRLLP